MIANRLRMTSLPLYIVDAFTKTPFTGNAAAVVLEQATQVLSDKTKQQVAAEMNLSETVFVTKLSLLDDFSSSPKFGLRWFTPATEVRLCGHATVATAAVLFNCCKNPSERLEFLTLSGSVFAGKQGDKIVLDFPQNKPQPVVTTKYQKLIKAAIGNLEYIDAQLSASASKFIIRLADDVSRSELEALKPSGKELIASSPEGSPVRGVIVTLHSQEYDFLSRYFAPWVGIDEDPVTGSAHTVLTPYWAEVLGKKVLTARQCSKRGGDLWLTLRDDGRVDIAGHATVVVEGRLSVPTQP